MSKFSIDLLFKFGGSAITDKEKFETLRPESLNEAGRCVSLCVQAGLRCMVVHGAGSFGHHQAKKYQINKGLPEDICDKDKELKLHGFSLTRQSVTKLNKHVVDSLIDVGVPAIAFAPGTSWSVDKKQATDFPSNLCKRYVETGFVPILHGDACIDSSLGVSILSGDLVIQMLCSTFDVKRVVFLTDVPGIYDKPPHEPGAKLIKKISVRDDGSVNATIATSQSSNDVTGGIKLKIETAVNIVTSTKGKCPVFICAVDSEASRELSVGKDCLSTLHATVVCHESL